MIGFSSKNKGFQDENEDELMTRNIEGHLDYYEVTYYCTDIRVTILMTHRLLEVYRR